MSSKNNNNNNQDNEGYYNVKKLINTYKLLQKRKSPENQNYVVYAYYLLSESVDGKHGKHIHIGAYETKAEAWEVMNEIINVTGHDSIYICKSCSWEDIDESGNKDRTIYIDPSIKSEELDQQYRQRILGEYEEEEKQILLTEELDEQSKKELDPETVEHYAHNWYNAIKNKGKVEYHKKQLEYYEDKYNDKVTKIKTQYNNNPDIEKTWLPIYKERLERRKEDNIYIMMEKGHKVLVDEILN